MKKNNRHSNWILRLAGILFCLTLFSVHLTSGLYARYTTSASGSDSARVARFDVQAEGELITFISADIRPGETVEKTVEVTNNSEVAITYTVTAVNKFRNLPLAFTFQKEGKQDLLLEPGKNATFTLSIQWPGEQNQVSYSGKVDLIQLTLKAEQAD